MGRPKGSRNKTPAYQRKIAEGGLTPLDYLLKVVRDENLPDARRMQAARDAAPYVHPRLSQVEQTVTHIRPIKDHSEAELLTLLAEGDSEGAAGPEAGEGEPTAVH